MFLVMVTFISHGAQIRMEQVEPAGPGPFPAVLVLHGAGGAVSYWFDKVGVQLAGLGMACYAVQYFDRTGTVRADAETIQNRQNLVLWLETIRDAVSYIAERPKVNAARIAVLGVSLGGFLATALGVEDARVKAIIEISGGMAPAWAERAHAKMPPTLILHGEQDTIVQVDEAQKLEQLLKRLGVAHEMELYPNEGHWFSTLAQVRIFMKTSTFLGSYL